jgi:imidazolonepropionase-like amidohydrolase
LAIVGATIYPSPDAQPIADGVVRIENGKIAAVGQAHEVEIPAGVHTIEARGLVLVPGFWNSHVHFVERKWADAGSISAPEIGAQLRDMLTRWGFTTVFDTGSNLDNTLAIRGRIESGEVMGPRIYTTGEILFPKNGRPLPAIIVALGFMVDEMPEVGTPAEGVEAAQRALEGGADAVKVYAAVWWGDVPYGIPLETMRAIVESVHGQGKLVLVHPSNADGLRTAIEAGADVVVHTAPESGPWDAELVETMVADDIAVIPTLKLWRYETRRDRASRVEGFIRQGIEQLRSFAAGGGTVLFGTDVGYMGDYDPTEEYRLMEEAGLDYRAILASLTANPARRFGAGEGNGQIAPGMDADLVLLENDPARDVAALAQVHTTIRGGRVIWEAAAE